MKKTKVAGKKNNIKKQYHIGKQYYIYIYMYVYIYICVCMYVCIHTHTHTHIYICIYMASKYIAK